MSEEQRGERRIECATPIDQAAQELQEHAQYHIAARRLRERAAEAERRAQGRAGQTLQELLDGGDAQSNTELRRRAGERQGYNSAAENVEKTSEMRVRRIELEDVFARSIQVRSMVNRDTFWQQQPLRYWQKTKITGVNPMEAPGAAGEIARMHTSMNRSLYSSSGEQAPLGAHQNRVFGRSIEISNSEAMQAAGPRAELTREWSEAGMGRERRYWQRTEVTGVDSMSSAENVHRRTRARKEVDLPRAVDCGVAEGGAASSPGSASQMAEGNGEPASGGAPSTMGGTGGFDSLRMTDRLNELRTKLGLRTAGDIFESSQREFEEKIAREGSSRKRARRSRNDGHSEDGLEGWLRKRARRANEEQSATIGGSAYDEDGVTAAVHALEQEFEEKVRQSREGRWCEAIPDERKVATVREFYQAFHDPETQPIHTCAICYRKYATAELEEVESTVSMLAELRARYGTLFGCDRCFASGKSFLGCAECVRELEKGALSAAAHVHNWLRCEHWYPDELKDLSPVEEKLIALNSCYGFITKYNVTSAHRASATYPKHVRGHITVFPNDVQELAIAVLPHPLLKVMDDIHVSWQGAEKPAPKDLSVLLSVRRRAVERALMWLKRNNPHYANIVIDTAEMERWGTPYHGVPSQIYERLERNEPSAWEKTRTAQLVPPTERGLEAGEDVDVREVLATLSQVQVMSPSGNEDAGDAEMGSGTDEDNEAVQEISASGMFNLDVLPDVADAEKLRYVYDALGRQPAETTNAEGGWRVQSDKTSEPYIVVSRGDDFADSKDAWFFAKTFPTLFPFGGGCPRQIEERMWGRAEGVEVDVSLVGEATARSAVSSRNLSLESWARIVLQRHGGRFAGHKVFSFLVFNMLVRYRNHQVSLMSVKRQDFPEVERVVEALSTERLQAAKDELKDSGKTSDASVNQLLRSLSLYGYRQPMSRELRLGMRRKIKSLLVREGVPAIWFTLNPNDITNPVKLKLAAYRSREPEQAEAFLTSLDVSYKRMRLAVSDPLSSALFFHREISMFFEYYVKVGKPSVFGRVSQYFGAVETNERGALHLHGLLWLQGNICLSQLWEDVEGDGNASYRDKVVQYVDSVFTEDLDQEAFCAIAAERSVASDISSTVQNKEQFSAAFEEEANFCAGATQIHTHSPTCVKYSINRPAASRNLCRFKAPWRLVEKTAFKEGGVLEIRRNHNMVNRWNKAMAVGLRHNHDISFIGTQSKTLAVVFYVTNYATKLEDPVWKRAAAAAEALDASNESAMGTRPDDRARQFLAKVANRVFTERALSQVEVAAHLLGFRTEFTYNRNWTYLNVSSLYWETFRRWDHLRRSAGEEVEAEAGDTVMLEHSGRKTTFAQAYPYRGQHLAAISLYEYMSVVKLKRRRDARAARGDLEFEQAWPLSASWVQALRRPGEYAVVCLDGYLSMDFEEEDERCHKRAAVQHLAMFVPWEKFLSDSSGDINAIWERHRRLLPRRLAAVAANIQLLRRSAEDARRDARQWAAQSGEADPRAEAVEFSAGEEAGDERTCRLYRADEPGSTARLIDVLRGSMAANQITAGSEQVRLVVQQLCGFEQEASWTASDFPGSIEQGRGTAATDASDATSAGRNVPEQGKTRGNAALYRVTSGFGEDELSIPSNSEAHGQLSGSPSMDLRFGPSTSFSEAGKKVAESLTLNHKQRIALQLLCRHLDRVHRGESNVPQLCQFVGGQGGTGKSRVIEAVVAVLASKGMSHRLLVTATSGTAAARINGITIHAACNISVDSSRTGPDSGSTRTGASSSTSLRVDGQKRMDWQDKDILIIDEISMLGARTMHAVDERLCILRGSSEDFGGLPIVLFLGDFRQFRPVQERSILVPSSDFSWDEDRTFRIEQRHRHDKAHMLWKKFTTVVMLDEQVRAAGDLQLRRLLTRIRQGVTDQTDVDLLNRTCYRESRRIPWESGITVVTPLNRNRWNLNVEATLSFQKQHRAQLRIFVSEHKWKGGQPTEEEALMIMGYGDDSSVPVPAIFMFVPGMPIVANRNTYPGLKLVNGSTYTALDVVLDKAYPGHRISGDTTLHFGPPAGIILAAESTKDLNFVGMPSGTILLSPLSSKIECARRRPWQRHDVTRRGLPCTAAFACTDYKVQGRTLDHVALELRGTRTLQVGGQVVPSQCDPYSLYVQLSRSTSLQGIMLLSKARERDIIGNTVPENMIAAERRLEELSAATVREVEIWNQSSPSWQVY